MRSCPRASRRASASWCRPGVGDGRDGGGGIRWSRQQCYLAVTVAQMNPLSPLLADEGFRGSAMRCQDGTVILIVEECGDDYVMCKAWNNHGFEIWAISISTIQSFPSLMLWPNALVNQPVILLLCQSPAGGEQLQARWEEEHQRARLQDTGGK